MAENFILAPGETFVQCPYNTSHQITNARIITHLAKCRKAYMNSLTVDGQQRAMVFCRYNATHHVPDAELKFHEERCPDATSVIKYLSHHEKSSEGKRYYEERRKELNQAKKRPRTEEDDWDCWDDYNFEGQSRGQYLDSWGSDSESPSPSKKGKPKSSDNFNVEEEDWESEAAGYGYAPGYDPKLKLKSQTILYHPAGLTKSERKAFRNEVFVRDLINTKTTTKVDLPVVTEDWKISMSKIETPTGVYPKEEKGDVPNANIQAPDHFLTIKMEPSSGAAAAAMSSEKTSDNNDEAWPWPDGDDDIYPNDTDDFKGFDPYA